MIVFYKNIKQSKFIKWCTYNYIHNKILGKINTTQFRMFWRKIDDSTLTVYVCHFKTCRSLIVCLLVNVESARCCFDGLCKPSLIRGGVCGSITSHTYGFGTSNLSKSAASLLSKYTRGSLVQDR